MELLCAVTAHLAEIVDNYGAVRFNNAGTHGLGRIEGLEMRGGNSRICGSGRSEQASRTTLGGEYLYLLRHHDSDSDL